MGESVWNSKVFPRYGEASGKKEFDVIVIGGGSTGLSAAYFLKRTGLRVALLERNRLAHGDIGATTAHLTAVTDTPLNELAASFGDQNARRIWDAGEIAVDAIENIVKTHALDCRFQRVPGLLTASLFGDAVRQEKESEKLKEIESTAKRLGIEARYKATVPVFGRPGVSFANQAIFDPMPYLAGLAKVVDGDGSYIFEKSEVTSVTEGPLTVSGDGFQFRCHRVIVATHVPLMGKTSLPAATLFQTKIAPYSSYVVGATLPGTGHRQMSLWDLSDPYFFLRIEQRKGSGYAILGGLDHKTGQVDDQPERYAKLKEILTSLIPDAQVDHEWSGQIIESHDGLPFIGEGSEHQFIATGFAGNGLTFGTIAGLMATDYVHGRRNRWDEIFSPQRKEIHSGGVWNYVKENFDYPIYRLKDSLSNGDADSVAEVRAGEGKIVKIDGDKVACYRDDHGKLHQVSAICTHMGCTVKFNSSETTWDCPCHGSRFKTNGDVIGGPAEKPLAKIKRAEKKKGKSREKDREGEPDKMAS